MGSLIWLGHLACGEESSELAEPIGSVEVESGEERESVGKEIWQITIGVLAVAALIAVVLGSARPTMVATGPDLSGSAGAPEVYSPEGGRVRGGSQSSGTSIFGLRFGGSWELAIEFQVSDQCYESVGVGDKWPSSADGCESEVPVAGEVTQRLQSEAWGKLLVVEMAVSSECWAVAVGGGVWPTGLTECRSVEER